MIQPVSNSVIWLTLYDSIQDHCFSFSLAYVFTYQYIWEALIGKLHQNEVNYTISVMKKGFVLTSSTFSESSYSFLNNLNLGLKVFVLLNWAVCILYNLNLN